jgi:hypothetical protein
MRKKYQLTETQMKKAQQEPLDKTAGTVIAEKARSKANAYSDVKRANLLKKGLSIIYGGGGDAKAHASRS